MSPFRSIESSPVKTGATVVPGSMAPVIRLRRGREGETLECLPAVFGIVPESCSVNPVSSTCIAPAPAVNTLPAYRKAWESCQFCIVPMHAFFESGFQKDREKRWCIGHASGEPLAAAGIWECRESGPNQAPLISYALLSVEADEHPQMWRLRRAADAKRMPVLLEPSQYDAWLHATIDEARQFLVPYTAERLSAQPAPLPDTNEQQL